MSTSTLGQTVKIPKTYIEARRRFLSLSQESGAIIESFINPNCKGKSGEDLFCDVAKFGEDKLDKKLIISSGTHGVEGFCGSYLQECLIRSGLIDQETEKIQVILVHALNPYGFSHQSRTNEDHVDLNRNFADFEHINKNDSDYNLFRKIVYPEKWNSSVLEDIYDAMDTYINDFGLKQFQRFMTQGQYCFDQDPYFGGLKPVWSHKIWLKICQESLKITDQVAHLDIHTGLGLPGTAELIYAGSLNQKALDRARTWYGENEVKVPSSGNSLTQPVSGAVACGLAEVAPNAVGLALEYGTVPLKDMLKSLIADTWLYNNSDCSASIKKEIISQVRNSFCLEDDENWRLDIWTIMERRYLDSIRGLTETQ